MPTVHDLFARAFRRGPTAPPGADIPYSEGDDRARVVIELRWTGGRVHEVRYRASTCITLLALCEGLLDWVPGMTPEEVGAITAETLLRRHPEIPESRVSRAAIVEQSLRRALLWKR